MNTFNPFPLEITKMQLEIDSQIELLLKHGIIEPSRSESRSPVVMVKKKGGTYRFACDYRRLNSLTEKQSYPMPKLEDVWDLIGETKPQYFPVLYLTSGFWQIRMDPETKHKASFVTRSGQYTGGAYSEEHLRNTWFRGTPSHCNIALIIRPKL